MYMYMFMNFGILFLILLGVLVILLFNFFMFNLKIFFEFYLYNFNSMKCSLILYLDYKSLIFMIIVMFISSMILFYSIEYMLMDLFKIRFLLLLFLFILSMLFMIVGQNLLFILLGWDGLGLISYCLVVYYNSWNSYNAGMLTIITNRLGDIGLLISIGLFSMFGSWNYLFFTFINYILILFMIICFITKSAQIPFSSWLPAAMAAPTPISSLVHSSTLVTAGIYLMMRFLKILLINFLFMKILLFMGFMTMFMSGIVACMENDFKKIIALSTLSQLGLMMMTLCLTLKMLSFFHLIIHALFKSLLFMCVGVILHSMLDSQDIRYLGGLNYSFFLTLSYFNCSNLALCGYPFMSGFYSKDLILEMTLLMNKMIFLMMGFYLSIGLTVTYTFRLLYYLNFKSNNYLSCLNMMDNLLMNYSMLMLFLFSIFGGVIFSNFFYSSISLVYLSVGLKLMVNLMFIMGVIMGVLINLFMLLMYKIMIIYYMYNFYSKLCGLVFLFENFYYFFNMNYYYYMIMEKGWINFYSNEFLYLTLNMFNYYVNKFNIVVFLYMFFMLMIIY